MAPRVRFAPSPTGHLHVGGARTALFNWLFARRLGGVFVLRIEDTKAERSSEDMIDGILDGRRWLGLDWDDGAKVGGPCAPSSRSRRLDRHRAMAEQHVRQGSAYYCYCTNDSLKAKRDAAQRARGAAARGASDPSAWRYDRSCCALTAEEIISRERDGLPRAIRFRVPEGTTRFDDLVHGPIEFDGAHIEDFVLLRSDGHPTYQLSVVSDDVEMKITHVVRGDDHISNTPKHIMRLAPGELAVRLKTSFEGAGLWSDSYLADRRAWFLAVLELLKPRAKRLDDFVVQGGFFFSDTIEYDSAAVDTHLRAAGVEDHLAALDAALTALETFDPASTEAALRAVAEARGVKAASLIHAARVAVTGRSASPGLFEVLALLGRARVHARLVAASRLFSPSPS